MSKHRKGSRKKMRPQRSLVRKKGAGGAQHAGDGGFDIFSLPLQPEVRVLTDGVRTCITYPEFFPQTVEGLVNRGFREMAEADAQHFFWKNVLSSKLDDTQSMLAQFADPNRSGPLGQLFTPSLIDRRRTPYAAVGSTLGEHFFRPRFATEHADLLVRTSTGEHVKPMRLLFAVHEPRRVMEALVKRADIEFDPEMGRLVWLSTNEHVESSFLPPSPPSTVLASLFFGKRLMWCQTNSSKRALAFLSVFSPLLEHSGHLLYGLAVDQFFTARELKAFDIDAGFILGKVMTREFLVESTQANDEGSMDLHAMLRFRREHPVDGQGPER